MRISDWSSDVCSSDLAIRRFFAETPHDRPVLAVDLSVVEWNYRSLALALPDTEIYYAVKANPAPELVDLLAALGSHFDVASRGEIELCLSRGIPAERPSFGNTIKIGRASCRESVLQYV